LTTETATTIQAIAAIVQAFAALVVLCLTRQLIQATQAYVQTTREQVTAVQAQLGELREARIVSEAQLNELRESRLASFRPIIHTVGVGSSMGGATPDTITLRVANLGQGPAVDLVFDDDHTAFTCDPSKGSIPAGSDAPLMFTARGHAVAAQNEIVLTYGDVTGGRWRTRVFIDLDRASIAERVVNEITEQLPRLG
jgi:hypothetical protein